MHWCRVIFGCFEGAIRGPLLQIINLKTSQSPGGQLCCSKDKTHISSKMLMMIMDIICGEGMARGVSSASPGIPFLQVPWPFLMLSPSWPFLMLSPTIQVDVITQRITFLCPLSHPGLLLGPPSYHLNNSDFFNKGL